MPPRFGMHHQPARFADKIRERADVEYHRSGAHNPLRRLIFGNQNQAIVAEDLVLQKRRTEEPWKRVVTSEGGPKQLAYESNIVFCGFTPHTGHLPGG